MPRAIWTGAISFGLVTVPVKVYSAIDRKTVRFHQLSGKTGVRVVQKRVDPQTGDEVPYEEIVKGYELAPDRYVVVEPAELDTLEPTKTRTIEIEDFVQLAQIDPIYYDHPYYLVPGTGGAKPYRLLLEAMEETGKGRDRARGDALQGAARGRAPDGRGARHGDDALRRRSALARSPRRGARGRRGQGDKARARVAEQLVESLAGDFEPDKYRDTYREQVLELIERKAQGKKIAVQPPSEEVAPAAPDLMGALKASLEAVNARAEPTERPKRRKGPAKAPAKKAAAKKPAAKKPGPSRAAAKR